jgi:hypothetical protein
MTTDTKLRVHDISSKGSLCYGGQTWIISNTGAEKLEAVQIIFLRPLLGLAPQDRQRKLDIRNRLKVDKIIEAKFYIKKRSPKKNGQKAPTEAGCPVTAWEKAGYRKTETKKESP